MFVFICLVFKNYLKILKHGIKKTPRCVFLTVRKHSVLGRVHVPHVFSPLEGHCHQLHSILAFSEVFLISPVGQQIW
jgi:hypothetical protein